MLTGGKGWALAALLAMAAAWTPALQVVVNGTVTPMLALVRNGTVLVGGAALAKALGGSVTGTVKAVKVNGKVVPLTAVLQQQVLLVDAAALATALGATAVWDAKGNVLTVTRPGAVRAPSDKAEFDAIYRLGKIDPIDFTLRGAEFTLARVAFGETAIIPRADEKLLVLRYTLRNPQKIERLANSATLHFTVVDAAGQLHGYEELAGVAGTRAALDLFLRPGQTVEAYTVIRTTAKGITPKLIVEPEDGAVLRFDLRGKVPALGVPFLDPADAGGASVRPLILVAPGVAVPTGAFDVQLDDVAFTLKPLLDDEPVPAGKRFAVFTLNVKNMLPTPAPLHRGTFAFTLDTAEGRIIPWNQQLLFGAKGSERINQEVAPGQALAVRVFFPLGAEEAAQTLRVTEGERGHPYAFTTTE